ncbi:MAG: Ig-like domain-containing protein, partial [Phycisphaerae bacterium]|nr:Ig-like domain-containing protein [Phycisphaerae bacterium]
MNARPLVTALVVLSRVAGEMAVAQAPKVAKTVPASEATDVAPGLDQIVITFDTPMKLNSHSLVVVGDLNFPDLVGDDPIYFPDNRTCIIKVKLQPNTAYGLGINSKTRTGFKSAEDGTPAVPFELRF